jgi:hypothetical protein
VSNNFQARVTTPESFVQSLTVGGVASITGFLAEAFRENPDSRERWIKTRVDGAEAQQSILHALALAGLQPLAITAMQEYGWSAERIKQATGPGGSISRIPPIWNYQPGVPADMDMFWGAFAASGKEQYVFKVLDIYKAVAAHPSIRVADIEFVADSFSQRMATRETFNRFKGYPDQRKIWLASAGTALWAMSAQAAKHERVKQILVAYIETNKKTESTWALARSIARSSKKILFVGPKETASIMVAFTRDPKFTETEVPKWFKGEKFYLPDKIFRRSDQPFMVILGMVTTGMTMEVQSELRDPQGNRVAQRREILPPISQSRRKDDAVISAASVGLRFKPDSPPGFYTTRFLVKTSRGEAFTGEIEFLLQE